MAMIPKINGQSDQRSFLWANTMLAIRRTLGAFDKLDMKNIFLRL
jgi:hypothetical protein